MLGQLQVLLSIRQVITDCVVVRNEVSDILDGEPLIRWDGDVPDIPTIDFLLLAADEVFEKVDGDLI